MEDLFLVNFAWDVYYNAIHLKKIDDGKEVIDFDENMVKKLASQWIAGKKYEQYSQITKNDKGDAD